MKVANLKAVVLRNPENVLFMTGYWPVTGWSIFDLRDDGRSRLLIPKSELEFVDENSVDEVVTMPGESLDEVYDPYKHIREFLQGLGVSGGSKVGAELSMETLATIHTGAELSFMGNKTLNILRERTGYELVDLSDALHRLRMVKTENEMMKISKACRIASIGLRSGLESLREGMTEAELAATIECGVNSNGIGYEGTRLARGFAYVMSGQNGSKASFPFNVSSTKRIKSGESILIELNVQADGFWADLTRTWFIGRPPEELRKCYEAVRTANDEAIKHIRDGVPVKELDAVARKVISATGLGSRFNHRLGHGIGFRLHEPPSIHPASNEIIRENMTFTIEPGVYDRGYGIRIEDVVVARRSGPERLSAAQEFTL